MSQMREAEPAVQPDEAGRRQEPQLFQSFWPPLEERDLFLPAWPDRPHEPPANP